MSPNSHHGSKENRHCSSFINARFGRWLFPLGGVVCLIWFLVRVVPKPSRLQYPCMKVAAPMASSFLLFISGLAAAVFSFGKARALLHSSRYMLGSLLLVAGLAASAFTFSGTSLESHASAGTPGLFTGPSDSANHPFGTARGILPGRVVWVHNPDATNAQCVVDSPGHGWVESENMNQAAVDQMLSAALKSVTGEASDSASWGAIFRYHNGIRGKGAVGYVKGEKIFIKINATSAMHVNPADLTSTSYYGVSETSMASVRAVLRQLVNVAGVAQGDISIGDPMKHIYKHLYDTWHGEFPDVHYLDHDDYGSLGREKAVVSTTARILYSDKRTVLPVSSDYLYAIFEQTEYVLNIPMLKGHQRAGMTMFAKNHFGSQAEAYASQLHEGLVSPNGPGDQRRSGYGVYRVLVDMLSHKLLSGKNLVYVMDALWSTDWELDKPVKWQMSPFNNDYTSSLFVSLDPLAIESVGYDFLRSEFTAARGADSSVQMSGVDDYLHQAADSANWPRGIRYDPDNDGVCYASLGVHEHWNSAIDKKYSRNLGTGNGIELIDIEQSTPSHVIERESVPEVFQLSQNYPNPFNPSTTIQFSLPNRQRTIVRVFDVSGRVVATLVDEVKEPGTYTVQFAGTNLASGVYIYRLQAGDFVTTKRLLLLK